MIFSIVNQLIRAKWIKFFETCFVAITTFYVFKWQSFSNLSIPGPIL